MSGYARVPRNKRSVTVEPGVDITRGSVIVAAPFGNLRGRSFWVTRGIENDTFTIRLSGPRGQATPFAWIVVENDELRASADAAVAAVEEAAAGDAEAAAAEAEE